MMRMRHHCICGASWAGHLPPALGQAMEAEWQRHHTPGIRDGENHGPCDAATATRHRRAAESRMEQERRARG